MDNNKMKYFPGKPWELNEKGKDYQPSAEAEGILSRLANSETNKITLKVLYSLIAVLGISYATEVFGEGFAEKMVVADSNGNIMPIINKDGDITVGDSIFVSNPMWEGVRGTFVKDSYLATDEDSAKLSIRDNNTLQETNSISATSPAKPVDLGNGAIAFVQYDSVAKERQIHIRLKDGTDQILTFNASTVYALKSSNETLYAALKDKTDNKYYIKIFSQNGEGQYAEDTESKIKLPAEIYGGMEVHSGKIAVSLNNGLYIYNQNTSQLDHTIPDGAPNGIFKGRPNANTLFIYDAVSSLRSIELTPPYKTTTIVSIADLTQLLDNDWDYVPSSAVFSNDGDRLYFATKSYTAQDKSVHYIVTIHLNPDGSVSKMEKSILTEGSSAPTPIDLAMDVDTDNDKITNAQDNCPEVANNSQIDKNNNGIGDACENPSDYAASVGYESYQEPAGTGHNVFSNGNVDIVDMGDKVVVSPVQGEKSEIEIINNGNEQTKGISVNIPPNTDYEWVSLEGQGDIEETPDVDFPEGQTINGSTEENGVLVGISGTDIKLKCTPKIVQPEQTESQSDEFTGADDVSIPDELTPDTAEEAAIDTQDAYEAKEITPDTAEIQPDTNDIAQPDQFDAYDPGQSDTGADAIQPDQNQPDTNQPDAIQSESEKPKNGGGGCDMNNNASENAKTLTLTGAALFALAATKRKIAKMLKG